MLFKIKVDIFVNDVKSLLTMKLNANGDGYFIIDNDKMEEDVKRKKRLSEIILNQSIILTVIINLKFLVLKYLFLKKIQLQIM